jgi:hypothetical protein
MTEYEDFPDPTDAVPSTTAPTNDCPFCGYGADAAARCPECGRMIPADRVDRGLMRQSIRQERGAWLFAAIGLMLTAGMVWLYFEVVRAVTANYFPGSLSGLRLISNMQSAIPILPILGAAYIAVRMRAGVRDRRGNKFVRCGGGVGSRWSVVAGFAVFGAWAIPALGVLLICAGLSG